MRGLPLRGAAAVLVLALAAWLLVQVRGGGIRVEQADPRTAAETARGTPPGSGDAAQTDPGVDSLGEMLEAQAGQLADLVGQMRTACAAAGAQGAEIALTPAARCAEGAEAVVGTADLIRGTVASPAGAAMPVEVRTRWDATLREAAAAVRKALHPVWEAFGRALASGWRPPGDVRALGHLRDRIGRVLSEVERP